LIFPRATPYGKVLIGEASLIRYIETNNNFRTCRVSVYAYNKFHNNKPYLTSAAVDLLFYSTDNLSEGIRYTRKLTDMNIRHACTYDGITIDLMVPLGYVSKDMHSDVLSGRELTGIRFSTNRWDYFTWVRTYNTKSRRFCIRVLPDDKAEDLDQMATKPLNRKVSNKGMKYIGELL